MIATDNCAPSIQQAKAADRSDEPCFEACSLRWVIRDRPTEKFVVELWLENRTTQQLSVTPEELISYDRFRTVVLRRLGVIFGDEVYERSGGKTAWREDLAKALNRGAEATKR